MQKLTGGAKLHAKLAELAKRVNKKRDLRVGFIEGAKYPDSDVTAPQAAFWLNYGTKTAPPRPFFTNMVREKSDEWADILGRLLADNDMDIDAALHLLGEGIEDQLRDAIVNLDSPALSKVTLMLRKMRHENPHLVITGGVVGEAAARVAAGEDTSPASTKVGVNTGHMLNSITHDLQGD